MSNFQLCNKCGEQVDMEQHMCLKCNHVMGTVPECLPKWMCQGCGRYNVVRGKDGTCIECAHRNISLAWDVR